MALFADLETIVRGSTGPEIPLAPLPLSPSMASSTADTQAKLETEPCQIPLAQFPPPEDGPG